MQPDLVYSSSSNVSSTSIYRSTLLIAISKQCNVEYYTQRYCMHSTSLTASVVRLKELVVG
jgi:hypothetical protein